MDTMKINEILETARAKVKSSGKAEDFMNSIYDHFCDDTEMVGKFITAARNERANTLSQLMKDLDCYPEEEGVQEWLEDFIKDSIHLELDVDKDYEMLIRSITASGVTSFCISMLEFSEENKGLAKQREMVDDYFKSQDENLDYEWIAIENKLIEVGKIDCDITHKERVKELMQEIYDSIFDDEEDNAMAGLYNKVNEDYESRYIEVCKVKTSFVESHEREFAICKTGLYNGDKNLSVVKVGSVKAFKAMTDLSITDSDIERLSQVVVGGTLYPERMGAAVCIVRLY